MTPTVCRKARRLAADAIHPIRDPDIAEADMLHNLRTAALRSQGQNFETTIPGLQNRGCPTQKSKPKSTVGEEWVNAPEEM